ncbi:uncharacterized protein LOC122925184 [Bufo gargarizans]|uniref:uncharacterized protein LOC122925184 n=1 Tax=Bufo gargarizans TaxID=30331 RepID=UPI001CF18CA7|nr:uncharacterized protein LOC122925184 [Bufo gargarizans]
MTHSGSGSDIEPYTRSEEGTAAAMASSQSTEIEEIISSKSSLGYFKLKELLSVEEIYKCLQKKSINKAGKNMRFNIEQIRSDIFLRPSVEFSITGLQHCTTLESTRKILESQSFIGTTKGRLKLANLSFWAVDVSSHDIEKARKESYTHVQKLVRKCEAEEYEKELMQQFANSPAFNKLASRYGNFQFSFQFSDLLSLYEAQFCVGQNPQLSILGTDIYKQEIVHYVVVHCPDNSRFKDHPRVPRLQVRRDPLPNVFLLGDTLYWRPESTSESLEVLSKKGEIIGCPLQPTCDLYEESRHCNHRVNCVWNQLVIAFNVPWGNQFKISVDKLINNLTACGDLQPFINKSKMEKTDAEKWISKLKKKYPGKSQELHPKVDSSHGEQSDRRTDRTLLTDNVEERREGAPTMGNEEVTITQMDTSTQQPLSTHVRVKQERTGGLVTGKHAAERERRGGPRENEENVEQCGPPLKKKK